MNLTEKGSSRKSVIAAKTRRYSEFGTRRSVAHAGASCPAGVAALPQAAFWRCTGASQERNPPPREGGEKPIFPTSLESEWQFVRRSDGGKLTGAMGANSLPSEGALTESMPICRPISTGTAHSSS